MSFGDVLTCIPYDERKNIVTKTRTVDILTLEEGLKVFLMLKGRYLRKSLRKVWSLKGFASSFWTLRVYGLLLAEYER
jgi:hypothetical protein